MNKNNKKIQLPILLNGAFSIDKRGEIDFVNDFTFDKVKRFYVVSTHKSGMIRAWHGHRYEAKYVYCISGTALVGAAFLDNWKNPSKESTVHQFVLSVKKPAVLYIPPGYANGFQSLTDDARLMVFSTKTVAESTKDDKRIDARHWDIWS